MQQGKRILYGKIISAVLFAVCAGCIVLLLWKIPYGWGAYDEPYYPSLAYRIAAGARPGIDEWNMGQWSSMLLVPFISAFVGLTGSTDGILLFCRSLYVVFQVVSAICIMRMFRSFGRLSAAAGIIFMIFVPFNIMAVSYDTMGLQFMTLAFTSFAVKTGKDSRWIFVSGVLFALAAVCNPYLALIPAVMVILAVMKKLPAKDVLRFIAGTAAAALVYIGALFMTSDIGMIAGNLKYLLSDSQHGARTLQEIVTEPVLDMFSIFFPWIYFWIAAFIFMIADRKRKKHAWIWMAVLAVPSALCMAGFCLNARANYIMLPVAVLGLGAYVLLDKRDRNLFIWIYLVGLLYAFLMNFASNQGMDIICLALALSDMASVLFIVQLINEHLPEFRAGWIILAAGIFLMQVGTEGVTFATNSFWESARIRDMGTVIADGPLKGVRTTSDRASLYEEEYHDLTDYVSGKNGRILIADNNSWEYMCTSMSCASFSVWTGNKDEATVRRLEEYYKVNKGNVPDFIYVSKLEEGKWDMQLWYDYAEKYGYDTNESDMSLKLERREID